MKVRWSRPALADLRGIRAYLGQDSPARADTVIARLREVTDILGQFPRAGRSSKSRSTREIVVARSPYVVVYRLYRSDVVIVRVRHGAQRLPE